MKISEVKSSKAPLPVGPYSQAVRAGNLIFCSGQIGIDRASGLLVAGGVAQETKQALENISAVLAAGGSSFKKVVWVDVFLTKMADFPEVNKVYVEYFVSKPKPSRQTIGVSSLPKNAKVEISCIAHIGD